MSVATLHIIRS